MKYSSHRCQDILSLKSEQTQHSSAKYWAIHTNMNLSSTYICVNVELILTLDEIPFHRYRDGDISKIGKNTA